MFLQGVLLLATPRKASTAYFFFLFFPSIILPLIGKMSTVEYQEDDPLLVPSDPEFHDTVGKRDDKPININSTNSYVSIVFRSFHKFPSLLAFVVISSI